MRWLVIAAVLAVSSPALADEPDPDVLFGSRRFAAAALVFEARFARDDDPVDGLNAAIAWRTGGHYARARVLVARIRDRHALAGEDLAMADQLDARLARLTGLATVPAAKRDGVVVTVDLDPPIWLGDRLALDVGSHEVTLSEVDCEPYVWQGTVAPGEALVIDGEPRCDTTGALHVRLAGDARGTFTIDGARHRADRHEATVRLPPGPHRIEVVRHGRVVVDREIAVTGGEVRSLHVPYPWRARGWVLVLGEASLASVTSGNGSVIATGLGLGIHGSRLRILLELGVGTSSAYGLDGPRPWSGVQAAVHLWTRPLWQGALGSTRVALDVEPLAIRVDDMRSYSLFGIYDGFESDHLQQLSFLPVTLGVDGSRFHVDATLWTTRSNHLYYFDDGGLFGSERRERGWGATLSILVGIRLR